MNRLPKLMLFAAVPLLIVTIAFRQASDRGSMTGLILDEDGPVSKASISARHVASGQVWHVQTATDGSYTLHNLPRGRYSLWIKAADHESAWLPDVFIERDAVSRQDFKIKKLIKRPSSSHPETPSK